MRAAVEENTVSEGGPPEDNPIRGLSVGIEPKGSSAGARPVKCVVEGAGDGPVASRLLATRRPLRIRFVACGARGVAASLHRQQDVPLPAIAGGRFLLPLAGRLGGALGDASLERGHEVDDIARSGDRTRSGGGQALDLCLDQLAQRVLKPVVKAGGVPPAGQTVEDGLGKLHHLAVELVVGQIVFRLANLVGGPQDRHQETSLIGRLTAKIAYHFSLSSAAISGLGLR